MRERLYSRGLFLSLPGTDAARWQTDLAWIDATPGVQHTEIWMEYVPEPPEASLLRDLLASRALVFHGPFVHLALASHMPDLADLSCRRAWEVVEFAGRVGARVVTLHAGTHAAWEPRQAALERLAKRFEPFTRVGSPAVTLENMPRVTGVTRECLADLTDMETFVEYLPAARFTLDVGHSVQNVNDHLAFLRMNTERILDVHLHDGTPRGRAHLRLGTGALDLPELLRCMKDTGYSGYVGLETISAEDTVASWEAWSRLEAES